MRDVSAQNRGGISTESRPLQPSAGPKESSGIRATDQGGPVAGVPNDAGSRAPVESGLRDVVPENRAPAGAQPGNVDGVNESKVEQGQANYSFRPESITNQEVQARQQAPVTESAGESQPMSAERAGAQAGEDANRQTAAAESASATPIASRDNTGRQQAEQPLREISPSKKEWVLRRRYESCQSGIHV